MTNMSQCVCAVLSRDLSWFTVTRLDVEQATSKSDSESNPNAVFVVQWWCHSPCCQLSPRRGARTMGASPEAARDGGIVGRSCTSLPGGQSESWGDDGSWIKVVWRSRSGSGSCRVRDQASSTQTMSWRQGDTRTYIPEAAGAEGVVQPLLDLRCCKPPTDPDFTLTEFISYENRLKNNFEKQKSRAKFVAVEHTWILPRSSVGDIRPTHDVRQETPIFIQLHRFLPRYFRFASCVPEKFDDPVQTTTVFFLFCNFLGFHRFVCSRMFQVGVFL